MKLDALTVEKKMVSVFRSCITSNQVDNARVYCKLLLSRLYNKDLVEYNKITGDPIYKLNLLYNKARKTH